MDANESIRILQKCIDDLINMTDEEFNQRLIECGIEDCMDEDEWERFYITGV